MRKDARLNLERVLAAAKVCFAERGAATTMEEVATRAGVGIGTLYRRFASRAALVAALYEEEVTQASARGAALADHPDAWEALARWCAAYVEVLATKGTLLAELAPLLERDAEAADAQRRRARATFERFLARAQATGQARADVDAAELVALLNAALGAGPAAPRMLAIVLDGLRRR